MSGRSGGLHYWEEQHIAEYEEILRRLPPMTHDEYAEYLDKHHPGWSSEKLLLFVTTSFRDGKPELQPYLRPSNATRRMAQPRFGVGQPSNGASKLVAPIIDSEGSTEKLRFASGKRNQPVPSVKMQLLSIIGSSHHANLVMAILVATFGWINLPPDLRIWGVAVGVIVLLTLSFARISSSEHLKQRDGNLSGNGPEGPRTGVESLGLQSEASKKKRQKTAGRRWANALLLAALVANLAWAFAANPKPEEPGIVASVVFGTWTLVRLAIFARTRGFGRRGQSVG